MQKAWDSVLIKKKAEQLIEKASCPTDRSRLLAAFANKSGTWLHAIPNEDLGLKLDNNTVRIAVALRIGAAVCQPHHCVNCGASVNFKGHHGLSCPMSAGRHYRHQAVNDLIKRGLQMVKELMVQLSFRGVKAKHYCWILPAWTL